MDAQETRLSLLRLVGLSSGSEGSNGTPVSLTTESLLSATLAAFGLRLTSEPIFGFEVRYEESSIYVGCHHLADLPRCDDGGRLNLTTLSSLFPNLVPDSVPAILRRLGLKLNDETLIMTDGKSFRCFWGTQHPEYLTVYGDDDWQVLLDNSAHGVLLEFDGLEWLSLKSLTPFTQVPTIP